MPKKFNNATREPVVTCRLKFTWPYPHRGSNQMCILTGSNRSSQHIANIIYKPSSAPVVDVDVWIMGKHLIQQICSCSYQLQGLTS